MQHHFLSVYRQSHQQLTTGLWLLHGDEILLSQWLIEKWQPQWRANHMTVSRMDITSVKSWQDILAELNNLSLFDDSKVIIAQGNHKPDKQHLTLLKNFATQHDNNCLIIIQNRYDKKNQKTAFFQVCEQHGNVVDCHLYQEQQREQLLKQQALDFGLQLTENAWQQLFIHTQNNLLTAYQSLWRLSYLYAFPSQTKVVPIQEEQLQDGLVSQSHFTIFDLSDAMLSGNLPKVAQILQHLKQVEEPESLVLWTIAKDMRIIQSLKAGNNYQNLGIWSTKQPLYQQALQRHMQQNTDNWTNLLYRCDQAIKGLIRQPAWELLYQLAFALTGYTLFLV